MITLSQGDCALAGISHSFPENPYLRAQVKRAPLGHRPCALGPHLVGGHFGPTTRLNVKTLVNLFRGGVRVEVQVEMGKLPLAHVCV